MSAARGIALVTGASSGLGLEIATLLGRDRHDLLLVARRRERLEEVAHGLAEEFGVRATAFAKDLSDPRAPAEIAEEAARLGSPVEILVNNAGFGDWGPFAETSLDEQLGMIQVNVVALTYLTRLFLPGMLERRRGRILNMASTAAFQPGPLMAVYYASKAYVLSFSEALASELEGSGVTVTALCPGPTLTEFQKRAGVENTNLFRNPMVLDASSVARAGYLGMMRGKRVVIPGAANRIGAFAVKLSPRRLATAMVRRINQKRG